MLSPRAVPMTFLILLIRSDFIADREGRARVEFNSKRGRQTRSRDAWAANAMHESHKGAECVAYDFECTSISVYATHHILKTRVQMYLSRKPTT